MEASGPPGGAFHLEIYASTTEGTIEGKCFDIAPKGRLRAYQTRLHDIARTDLIRNRLIRHLDAEGLLKA